MYIVSKYHRQVGRFIGDDSPRALGLAALALVVALAAIGGFILHLGAPAMNGYAWDSPIILDGAWRILNGLTPHRDFYNFFGDLPLYTTCMGMKLNRPCMSAIDDGNVVMMAVLSLTALAVLRRRTSAFYAFLFSLFVGLLVVTPRALGDPYDYTDHAMLYNRYGEAVLAILNAIIFLPPRPGTGGRWLDGLEAALAGAALGLLLGCKANYLVVGSFFLGAAVLTGRFSLRHGLICVVCAAAFLALALSLTGIPLSQMIHDYRMMAACQSPSFRFMLVAIQGVKSLLALPALLLLAWEACQGEPPGANAALSRWRYFLVMGVFYAGAVLLLASNAQVGEMPALAMAALCGAEVIRRQSSRPSDSSLFGVGRQIGALALVLLFLCPTLVADLKTLRFATFAVAQKRWITADALKSTLLSDFGFVPDGTRSVEMDDYRQELEDGVQLLRRHPTDGMRLTGFLGSNPYNVALGLRPASGGAICVVETGFVKTSHPPLSRMFGDATHILVGVDDEPTMKDVYGAEWTTLPLEIVEQTKHFTLYKIPPGLKLPVD